MRAMPARPGDARIARKMRSFGFMANAGRARPASGNHKRHRRGNGGGIARMARSYGEATGVGPGACSGAVSACRMRRSSASSTVPSRPRKRRRKARTVASGASTG